MIVKDRLRMVATRSAAALATATLFALAGGASAQDKPAAPGPIVKTLLQATATADGKAFAYPDGKPLVTARLVELPPGGEIIRHRHAVSPFVYILEGELTIASDSMPTQVYKAGDSYIEQAAWHSGRNLGATPVRLLSVYPSAEGVALSERPQ
ncbi:quercetin dioxygenase-like cupin family protein [Azospirillum brasilense]|uniref:Quercetin dioxygenase-like cupin family protein n=1 Tax=Azospirillum brasilense TaxID=192 RepID=A0A560AH75_AZOBR|nr:cupin domain-containing protein [Azospirillum brasilense]TWA59717.1 quercetin dioxygenase-like cupin family protein [Azospirillum brasilense]